MFLNNNEAHVHLPCFQNRTSHLSLEILPTIVHGHEFVIILLIHLIVESSRLYLYSALYNTAKPNSNRIQFVSLLIQFDNILFFTCEMNTLPCNICLRSFEFESPVRGNPSEMRGVVPVKFAVDRQSQVRAGIKIRAREAATNFLRPRHIPSILCSQRVSVQRPLCGHQPFGWGVHGTAQ